MPAAAAPPQIGGPYPCNKRRGRIGKEMTAMKLIQILVLLPCLIFNHAHAMQDISSRRKILLSPLSISRKASIITIDPRTRKENSHYSKRMRMRQSSLLVHTLRGGASEAVNEEDRLLVDDKEDKKKRVESQGKESMTGIDAENKDGGEEESEDEREYESESGEDVTEDEEDGQHSIHNEHGEDESVEDDTSNCDFDNGEESQRNESEITTTEATFDQVQLSPDDAKNDMYNIQDSTATTPTTSGEKEMNDEKSFQDTIDLKQNEASSLRIQGKQLHDDGDFQSAAKTFQRAASELDFVISIYQQNLSTNEHLHPIHNDMGDSGKDDNGNYEEHLSHTDLLRISEERATCRLHEALCHLKNKNYAESIISCTDVLMDGVQVVPLTEEECDQNSDKSNENGERDNEEGSSTHQAVIVRISSNGDDGGTKTTLSSSSSAVELSPAIRARAYHRRAKARLALGDATGALDDARSAAFLGDRNAVALYGKLMRNAGGNMNIFGDREDFNRNDGSGGDIGSLFSSASPLESLLAGDSNADGGIMNNPSSLGMLSSMLSKQSDGTNSASPFGALGGLGSFLDGSESMNGSTNGIGGGMDGLAKSVLSSLTKKIEDKSTQEMVCNYLNNVDAAQISSLSSMAGVPLSSSTVDRIVGFANKVTPKKMRKTIKLVKRILFVGNTLRKIFQVIGKYKHLLVLVLLIAWMKSAILRPVIVKTKTVKKAAETLSKATFII